MKFDYIVKRRPKLLLTLNHDKLVNVIEKSREPGVKFCDYVIMILIRYKSYIGFKYLQMNGFGWINEFGEHITYCYEIEKEIMEQLRSDDPDFVKYLCDDKNFAAPLILRGKFDMYSVILHSILHDNINTLSVLWLEFDMYIEFEKKDCDIKAIENGHWSIFEFLLDNPPRNAIINDIAIMRYKDYHLLMYACKHNRMDIICYYKYTDFGTFMSGLKYRDYKAVKILIILNHYKILSDLSKYLRLSDVMSFDDTCIINDCFRSMNLEVLALLYVNGVDIFSTKKYVIRRILAMLYIKIHMLFWK